MKSLFDEVSLKCSKLTTNSYSTSFSLGIMFLDKSIHDQIYAIYGFVRFADEIVDSFHEFNKEELLEEFKKETWNSIKRGISLNPILNSFQAVVNNYKIDHELIEQFLYSMELDLEERKYDRALYEKYILGSAEVVGLMCLKVFVDGNESEYQRLKAPAMSLGAAFQKVNFLRDLKQDSGELGRSYFPQLQEKSLDLSSKEELVEEIKKDFSHAYEGIRELPNNCRYGVYVAYTYYQQLLYKISKSSVEKIKENRIRVSDLKKMYLAFKAYLKYKSGLPKQILTAASILICLALPVNATSIEQIRNLYIDCDTEKTYAINFYDVTMNEREKSISNQGYFAAAKMVKAKYGFNPMDKIMQFREGRKKLEALIKENPDNLELRYIRLAVQHSAPFFLSYKDDKKEDKKLLIEHINSTQAPGDFEDNVLRFLTREKLI